MTIPIKQLFEIEEDDGWKHEIRNETQQFAEAQWSVVMSDM